MKDEDGLELFSAYGLSMYPTILPRDKVLVKPTEDGGYVVGDIIAYVNDGRVVCHRIEKVLGGDGRSFKTRGDNHPKADPYVVGVDSVLGRVCQLVRGSRFVDPYVGRMSLTDVIYSRSVYTYEVCINRPLSGRFFQRILESDAYGLFVGSVFAALKGGDFRQKCSILRAGEVVSFDLRRPEQAKEFKKELLAGALFSIKGFRGDSQVSDIRFEIVEDKGLGMTVLTVRSYSVKARFIGSNVEGEVLKSVFAFAKAIGFDTVYVRKSRECARVLDRLVFWGEFSSSELSGRDGSYIQFYHKILDPKETSKKIASDILGFFQGFRGVRRFLKALPHQEVEVFWKKTDERKSVFELVAKMSGFNAGDAILIRDDSFGGKSFRISNLMVGSLFRCRGVGSALVEKSLEIAGENGGEKVALTVKRGNSRAIRFYEGLGFKRVRDRLEGVVDLLLTMEKPVA